MILAPLALAATLQAPPTLEKALIGSWIGTLEYRDFSDDSRQRLATLLRISKDKSTGRLVFRYVYDDGPKKLVQDSDQIEIDAAKSSYTVIGDDGSKDEYTVKGLESLNTKKITLTLLGKGTENHVAVDIRQTLSLEPSKLRILRESKLPGQSYKFRHEFLFTRVIEQPGK